MDDKLKKKIIYELIKTFINAGDIALKLRQKGLRKLATPIVASLGLSLIHI